MINHLQRLIGKLRHPAAPRVQAPRPADLNGLRSAMLDAVQDCSDSGPAQRLYGRIVRASNSQDLWVLRADAHDVIARHHCQRIAGERMRHLEQLRIGSNP